MAHYLITGAGGGIGRDLAVRLAGHQLTVAGRDAGRLSGLGADRICAADLSTEAGAAALAATLADAPPLDGAAHCVGSLLLKPAHRTSLDEWRAVMAANLDSAFLVLRVVAGLRMRGSLVLCSSVAAGTGFANHEAISAAKAGIEGLVRSAAATYAGIGLRVNAVAPGLTATPLTATLTASDASRQAAAAMHPLGRLGAAGDQAAAIAWLLSAEAGWITGQVLGVDGGLGRIRTR